MEYPSLSEIEFVAHELASRMMAGDEPIPSFTTRFANRLESCLSVPQQTYDKQELYPNFLDKAAILFYLMIKNHPFENGNKRIAVMTLLFFLYKNNKWLKLGDLILYQFAKDVAASDAKKKDDQVEAIKVFLKPHITALE